MQTSTLILALLLLTAAAYQFGRRRSLSVAGGRRGARKLHSLPAYYGLLTAIWCGLPALLVVLGWQALDDRIIADKVIQSIPQRVQGLSPGELSLVLNDVRNVVAGNVAPEAVAPEIAGAARLWQKLDGAQQDELSRYWRSASPLAGGWITLLLIKPGMRGAQSRRADRPRGTAGLLADRDTDHHRHCSLGAVSNRCNSSGWFR